MQSPTPNTETRAPYGPLVSTSATYGISRSVAFAMARAGVLETFRIGRRRYVYIASLDSLPERLQAPSGARVG